MNDVLELGRGECRISCHDGWWVIASDEDWLMHPEFSVRQLFENVVPAPEHGEHSLRAEVLVNAFASDVFTIAGEVPLVVRGEAPEPSLIARAVEPTWCKRLIAFPHGEAERGLARANVMEGAAGNFLSGWKLNPAQLQNVLTHGGL